MIIDNIKNPDKKYRPIPFWSWNEKLETAETAEQVSLMNDAGIGGFFMHARGGLQTEYMSDEWFKNVESATAKAEELGMRSWAYDENGWPSGFGSGKVNGLGVEYQQKYLRMEKTLEHTETAICKSGGHYFYYDINPFYVDTLDKKVVKAFIESTYQPYYEKFRNRIEGFFTDEPQISRNGIPWSFVFDDEYKARYNENLYEHLEELFFSIGDYKCTRIKFWKMVTDLFSDAYCKQIYDWCDERGLKLTGHLVLEETLESQLVSNGACMPHYEYFHIPGMDWLGRDIYDCLTARQVSSVAEQLGRDSVMSETFAMCGHNVSFDELKGVFEWQMIRGINLLCQHLEGYSIRGIRKRDYPPAMYCQQPWWSDYGKWVDALSRIGMILCKGEKRADVLLLHPQTTAWTLYDDNENAGLEELNQKLLAVIKVLEEKHIQFHFGDETIMERHAKIKDGKIIIGKQQYSYVIDCCCEELLDSTKKLLDEYEAQNGKIVTVDELQGLSVTNEKTLTYTIRYYDGYMVHYFVNSSPDEKYAEINVDGRRLDIYTGELCEFNGVHRFEPWGSLIVFEDGTRNAALIKEKATHVYPDGEFRVKKGVLNAITLDKCDYYFDDVLQEKNGYVLNICERANALERQVKIRMDYHIKVNSVPEKLYLVCETPEMFAFRINGKEFRYDDQGYFVDKSFRKTDISRHIHLGENEISIDCDFIQSNEFYENLRKSFIFESEKNKLVYDMEIEPIYIVGDFSVKTSGNWEVLERNSFRYSGDFEIDAPRESISLKNIQKQGFPFFCGEMTLEGEIEVCGENPVLIFERRGINAVEVEIGNFKKSLLTDNQVALQGVDCGRHLIRLTIKNNLRNLLGPHHLEIGESIHTGPSDFYKEKCVWNNETLECWNEDYCFVEISL